MRILAAMVGVASFGTSSAAAPKPIFSCSLGAKRVSIEAAPGELIYRFGTPAKTELTIRGSAARQNLFYRAARYANVEYQLRFTNGRYSYIVFSVGGNPSMGAEPLSGLTVLDGFKQIGNYPCRRYTQLDPGTFDANSLPQDSDKFSPL